jgi:A118 family predicted phage portal protein
MQTATQVVSENSKTFGTIKAHENILRDELTEMVKSIFELAVKYGLTWQGKSVAALLAGGYDISVKFDDSIIQDRQTDINEGTMLVGAGLMSKKRFMTDTLGLTPEEADAELAQINAEGARNAVDVTRLFGSVE